jgi:amidase
MVDPTLAPPFDSARSLAAALRARELSATEALDAHLDRIDAVDPVLNAFAYRDDEQARVEARAADAQLVDGGDVPPFCGVPIPVKDLNHVAGWPTTHGSRASSPEPAVADDPVVARLRSAGFVMLGKTTTPELGTISFTESERLGVTRNPWDTDRTPGGSSGGAGAAVASGMATVGHASDGGGSIRIPASSNGLVGLKASRNRITGDVERLTAATTQGVLTRTVADTAALLDVLSAVDPLAWNTAPPPARPFLDEVGADPGRLRVMVSTDNPLGVPPMPECAAAARRTGDVLADLGHEVFEGSPVWGDPEQFLVGFLTVWATISVGAGFADPSLMEAHNRANRAAAEATSSVAYLEAAMGLQATSRTFAAQWGRDFDLLVTPTMAVEPPEVGTVWQGMDEDPLAPLTNCTPMAAYTAVFNVTGLPAISLPVHVSASGLPVGAQLAAGPWQEATLIRVAAQIEAAAPWVDRHPTV